MADTMAPPAQGIASPPDSNKESPSLKHEGSVSDSELSDIEDPEEDIGEVVPDHFADDGRVPVFKPTMHQFKSFQRYMKKINPYGMKSGIVKVIPPPEWKTGLPRLDEAIKTIRVKEPIKQDIMGTSGTYRQANILHQRSYNLPQWRQLCEQSEHQPPAKRGERRLNQEKPARPTTKPKTTGTSGSKKKAGRPFKNKGKAATVETEDGSETPDRLPTPVSPTTKADDDMDSVQNGDYEDDTPVRRMGGRQPKAISVSSRRKYNRKEAAAKVDEEAFKNFKYELEGEDYSPERCEELERAYWKTLTYAPPLYGADMPGSLFDDRTTTWNLGKLENLLDVMGTKIPGVNTAYLYLGMWKATFAWHLEDVDLYSINFLHFGAPKQWYSISQGDARRFEAAMKTIWPTDAKACDQFLRHKTFLISPSHLLSNFNIKVNKIVHHPGEFVITFPYGYHSGYNLGYNCAEAVNFALDSWLEYGRVAKKCDCSQAQDSVWIDVREIERKLRGEETEDEFTDEEDEEDDDGEENGTTDLPTPPDSSGDSKIKAPRKKRKRPTNGKDGNSNVKRIRVRIKAPTKEPCILCPNDIPSEPLLPTEDGQQAHRMCALYIPETSIESEDKEMVTDIKYIDKARLDLKCNYCRSKKGACFQCSQKKCTRAYHATCAAAAGVLVEQGEIPVFGEDGTEYKEWGIEFSCRFHRSKRDKKLEANDLSEVDRIRKAGAELKAGEICQLQYHKADIFAGAVVENHQSEEMLLIDILPRGERIEVEYKWLLIPDPTDFHLQKPSANAIPMPKSFKAKESLNTSKRQADDLPRQDDPFVTNFTWAEFKNELIPRNAAQVKIDFTKENQIWYYLGKNSTEAKAQFTEDLANPRHNPKGLFLETLPKPVIPGPRVSYAASYPSGVTQHTNHSGVNQNALNASRIHNRPAQSAARPEKPYVYKPRDTTYKVDTTAYRSQQSFLQKSTPQSLSFGSDPRWQSPSSSGTPSYPSPYPASTGTAPYIPRAVLAPPAPYQPHTQYQPPLPRPINPFGHRSHNSKPNPFAKYSYLQKEHNRSPLEYKSPYRPGGGFMNGYQGDLEKHLQQSMFNRSNSGSSLYNRMPTYGSNQRMHPAGQSSPSTSYISASPTTPGSYGVSSLQQQTAQFQQIRTPPFQTSDRKVAATSPSQLHPAIRQEFHTHYQPQRSGPSPLQTSAGSPPYQTPQPQQSSQERYPQDYRAAPLPSPASTTSHSPLGPHTTNLPTNKPQYTGASQPLYQETKPVYPHQTYFQKPAAQPQMSPTHPQAQATQITQRDLIDVPVDSTSIVEKIFLNLRKATSSST